jgi:putative thiamine transport system substrate-binding protein
LREAETQGITLSNLENMMNFSRRSALQLFATAGLVPRFGGVAFAGDWNAVAAAAKGQEVFFNAWGGSYPINAYIQWAADEVAKRYGVKVTHVKLSDTGEAVKRVRAEVAASKKDGSVDLIWINGENFKVMKAEKLLFGPFAEDLPSFANVDTKGKPSTLQDFSEKVEGLEAPWGMAQFTFFADGAKLAKPPLAMKEFLNFAKANPGRVTYSAPPDFHGTTFVKQAMVEVVGDKSIFAAAIDKAGFEASVAKPLYEYLDALRPSLWRAGKQYPKAQTDITQMVSDGELLIGLTFNPNEPANLVAAGKLPKTTLAWQNSGGTIGNTHFVAIPTNTKAKEGAQILANFLLSPEAQARKADIKIWGDPTVLDVAKLSGDEAKAFAAASGPGAVTIPGPVLLEPHASFVRLIEESWLARYGQG